ncbi:hypothetical protein ACFLXG_02780 [Chloroflexota bacterium]
MLIALTTRCLTVSGANNYNTRKKFAYHRIHGNPVSEFTGMKRHHYTGSFHLWLERMPAVPK